MRLRLITALITIFIVAIPALSGSPAAAQIEPPPPIPAPGDPADPADPAEPPVADPGGENPFPEAPPPDGGDPVGKPAPVPWTPTYEPPTGEFSYDQANFDDWLDRCRNENPDQLDPPPWYTFGFGTPQLEPARECDVETRSHYSALDQVTGGGQVSYGRGGIGTSNYDIGVDPGAWDHWDRKALGLATNTTFTWSTTLTAFSIRVLEWSLEFPIAEALDDEAGVIAGEFHTGLNQDATAGGSYQSAYNLALFATIVVAAFNLLMGRTGRALSEFAVTYIIYALFVGVIASGGMTRIVSETMTAASGTGGAIASIVIAGENAAASCPEGAPISTSPYADGALNPIICPIAGQFHEAFVERPYDIINWGEDLEGTPCAETRDAILFAGPWGNDDQPRYMMGATAEQCQQYADFNHEPSSSRLVLAMVHLLATWIVLFGVLGLSITLALVQLTLLAFVALTPFAVLAGIAPGGARELLWKWATGILKVFFMVVAISFGLSFYLVVYQALLAATADMAWGVQAFALITVTVMGFLGIKKLRSASNELSKDVAKKLSTATKTPQGGFVAAMSNGWANPNRGYVGGAAAGAAGVGYSAAKAYALYQLSPLGGGVKTSPTKLPPPPTGTTPPPPRGPGSWASSPGAPAAAAGARWAGHEPAELPVVTSAGRARWAIDTTVVGEDE